MATTGVRLGEATGPRDETAPETPRPRQAALTAEGSGLIPGSRRAAPQQQDVPEAGDGATPLGSRATFAVGGNLLNAWAHDPVPPSSTSMAVTFKCPGLQGGLIVDFGDKSEPVEINSLPQSVEHEYPALSAGATSVVYDATIRDEHNRLRGWIRFRLPHNQTLPKDLRAGHPASLIV
jgi:hypothetical protein